MSLLNSKNKKAQEGINSIIIWLLSLGLLGVAAFAFRAIIIKFKG